MMTNQGENSRAGVVHYTAIESLTPKQVILFLQDSSKVKYGSLTYSSLQLGNLPDIPITEKWFHSVFGYGVYLMFDGDELVYIGAAKNNFLDRLVSNRSFDGREPYGYNVMARKAAERKLGNAAAAFDQELFNMYVIPIINEFQVVRINCLNSHVTTARCLRLERLLIAAAHTLINTLYNSKVDTQDNLDLSLNQLLC